MNELLGFALLNPTYQLFLILGTPYLTFGMMTKRLLRSTLYIDKIDFKMQ